MFPCRAVRRSAPPVAMLSALELHAEIIALSSRRPPHCPLESVRTSSYACIAFGRPGTPISDRDSMSRERPSIARFETTIPYQSTFSHKQINLCRFPPGRKRADTNGEAALRAQAVASGSVEVLLSFPIHGLPAAALFSRARDPWQCAAMECWLVLACQYMHRHLWWRGRSGVMQRQHEHSHISAGRA